MTSKEKQMERALGLEQDDVSRFYQTAWVAELSMIGSFIEAKVPRWKWRRVVYWISAAVIICAILWGTR